jgi:hypothetical protein
MQNSFKVKMNNQLIFRQIKHYTVERTKTINNLKKHFSFETAERMINDYKISMNEIPLNGTSFTLIWSEKNNSYKLKK